MGTDIVIFVETEDATGTWRSKDNFEEYMGSIGISYPLPDWSENLHARDYRVYSWLAGVRRIDRSDPPALAAPRGVPTNVSRLVRLAFEDDDGGQHHSHFTVMELLKADYPPELETFMATIESLPERFNRQPEEVRIVFWFD
jgi:hypothetical protein